MHLNKLTLEYSKNNPFYGKIATNINVYTIVFELTDNNRSTVFGDHPTEYWYYVKPTKLFFDLHRAFSSDGHGARYFLSKDAAKKRAIKEFLEFRKTSLISKELQIRIYRYNLTPSYSENLIKYELTMSEKLNTDIEINKLKFKIL